MAEGQKLIATNPNARSDYFLEEIVEAGLVLTGTEIKSVRNQAPNIKEAFVEVSAKSRSGKEPQIEAWLVNAHIGPYTHGNIWNHEVRRRRKLLLHRHQLDKLYGAVIQKGMTIIPTRMYYVKGRAKIEIGLGKGKKKHDKRQDIQKRSADREVAQALKKAQRPRDRRGDYED